MSKKTPGDNAFGDTINVEEEFDFDEKVEQTQTDEARPKMPPPLPGMRTGKRSKLPFVLGGVVGILILWKASGLFFGGEKEPVFDPNSTLTPMVKETTQEATPKTLGQEIKAEAQKIEQKAEIAEQTVVNEAEDFLKEIRALQHSASTATAPATTTDLPVAATPANPSPAAVAPAPAETAAITAPPAAAAEGTPDMQHDIFERPMPTADQAQPPAATAQPAQALNLQPILDKLEEQSAEADKRMSNLEQQLQQFNERIEHMQDDMGQVNQDVMAVSQNVKGLSTDVKRIGEPLADQHKTDLAKTDLFANPKFAVHAIIPGRAWLKNQAGNTITVTEGDNLDQYGKILAIDAPNSAVVTSSGVVIR